MNKFTICLPHLRNPGNDAAFKIALDCLLANTVNEFHLLIDTATDVTLYECIHWLVVQATTECVVYTASDTFPAPGWDVPMLDAWTPNTMVFGCVTEPGVIGVFPGNFHEDFGRRPETFNQVAFEAAAAKQPEPPPGYGFPAPFMFPRTPYLACDAPLRDAPNFYLRDDLIIDRMVAAGVQRARVKSYFYHIQRYSDLEEQNADKRR